MGVEKLVLPNNTRLFRGSVYNITRKYMHAETLADKTIVFSEREVFKVVVMVTQ
jgi:hypothetical protein